MKFVYILEDDVKFKDEIVEAISAYDPRIQMRLFSSLQEFIAWLKEMMLKGPSAIATAGLSSGDGKQETINPAETLELVAIISRIEFLGIKEIPLLKRTRDLFIKRKICTEVHPTTFVLTAFEDPELSLKELEDSIINNIIFKPFDPLILKQQLIFAIEGNKIPSNYAVTNQPARLTIENLKNIDMKYASEIGFITESNIKIEKGRLAKYYGTFFSVEKQTSLVGRVLDCKENPDSPNSYRCEISYFGLSTEQASAMRRKIRSKNIGNELPKKHKTEARKLNFVIIENDQKIYAEIADLIKRRFEFAAAVQYKNVTEFLMDFAPEVTEADGKSPSLKALPVGHEVSFIFDPLGRQILDIIGSKKDTGIFFDVSQNDILQQTNWWAQAIGNFQMETWKDWLKNPKKEVILIVRNGDHKFYIRPKSVEKSKADSLTKVKFLELTTEERRELLLENSKLPEVVDALIVSDKQIQEDEKEKWELILNKLQERSLAKGIEQVPQTFIISTNEYSAHELIKLGELVADVFYFPLDRTYFIQKMSLYFPALSILEEPISTTIIEHMEQIKAASPVIVSEVSETGLIMPDHYAIELGAIREFVLWQPHEFESVKLIGKCNYVDEVGKNGLYKNHFVFLGVSAQDLKNLRLWIRENNIESKRSDLEES